MIKPADTLARRARLQLGDIVVEAKNFDDADAISFWRVGGNSKPVTFQASDLTVNELDRFLEFLADEVALIRPRIEELDRQAQEDLENGIPNRRLYRPLPAVDFYNRPKS